jgi:hypothetical protein
VCPFGHQRKNKLTLKLPETWLLRSKTLYVITLKDFISTISKFPNLRPQINRKNMKVCIAEKPSVAREIASVLE